MAEEVEIRREQLEKDNGARATAPRSVVRTLVDAMLEVVAGSGC